MRIIRLALMSTCALLCGCGGSDQSAPPPLVRVMTVADAAADQSRYTGTVHARIESDLGFRVPGKIISRLVDPGDSVRAGQSLMRLDANDLLLSAQSAADQRIAARSLVDAAGAEAERASADVARVRKLAEKGFVSAATLDRSRAANKAALASLVAAKALGQAAISGSALAANQALYASLAAGTNGIVTDVLAQPGEVVTAGRPILRFAADGPRDALVNIPEQVVRTLPAAARAEVYGMPGKTFDATLRDVSGSADPATRTYAARYEIRGGEALPLGATVTIAVRVNSPRIGVPLAALHDNGGGAGVWIIGTDNRISFRRVSIAAYGEEEAIITGGLRRGERIVALGAHLLKAGQTVRPDVAATRGERAAAVK